MVAVPGGAAHAFANATDQPARQLVMILPALDAQSFFTELGDVMQGGIPDKAAMDRFGTRWQVEFLGPPLAV